MIKKALILVLVLILTSMMVSANGDYEHDFTEAKALIDSGISCDELTEEQLEEMGDYYMELMHPGETHEVMDNMMGGEGSESLRQIHIAMASSYYCGENVGMMNMMNMMGSGSMMGFKTTNTGGGKMMGYFGWPNMGFGFIFMIIFWGLIIWLIIWLITKYAKPQQTDKSESAMEILRKRFAKGEINKKKFEDMKKEL